MKKSVKKKLMLNRETLVGLEHNLEQVAGGVTGPKACTFSGLATCGTCGATCGTNLC
ncbi:MAG TPA: hypothetical protein VKK31_07695 [Thermoanaerobaculia bacterium]|nr:hypothetical protein [Thermoanaerobaculia bacterium]